MTKFKTFTPYRADRDDPMKIVTKQDRLPIARVVAMQDPPSSADSDIVGFIVTACNYHKRLVRITRELRELLPDCSCTEEATCPMCRAKELLKGLK